MNCSQVPNRMALESPIARPTGSPCGHQGAGLPHFVSILYTRFLRTISILSDSTAQGGLRGLPSWSAPGKRLHCVVD